MSSIYSPRDGEPIRIIQITDTHFAAGADAELDGVDVRRSLAAVLAHINAHEPHIAAIIATGDLSHDGSAESYVALRDALQPLETPVFCIAGNHDDPDMMQRYLPGGWVLCAEEAQLGAWQLLLLNTHVPAWDGGELGAERRADLESRLAQGSQAPALVILHHAPISIASPWMDAMRLRDSAAFLELVDRYPRIRAVVWGHVHQAFEQSRNGVWFWATPSTCVQFRPRVSSYARDDCPPGYRRLLLYPDGSITSEVARVGGLW